MTKIKKLLMALLVSGLLSVSAEAAMVYLKDGSRMQGTIVGATAQSVQLYTPDGTLTISTDRIQRIEYNAEPSESNSPSAPVAAPTPLPPESTPVPSSPPYQRRRFRAYRVPEEAVNLNEEPQIFSFDFGLAAPISKINFSSVGGGSVTNGDAGVQFGAQYLYHLSPRLATGFGLAYSDRGMNDSLTPVPLADTTIYGDSLLLLGVMKYTLVDHGYARPYFLAGLGTDRTSTIVDVKPIDGNTWDTGTDETRRFVDDSNWGLASTLRLGIDFHFMAPSLFSFEVGWTQLSNSRFQPTPDGRDFGLTSLSGNLSTLDIGLRWGWRF